MAYKEQVNAEQIPDKAIGVSKLADGTDGELITWDASGVAATVATGTTGQVLTSNGAGTAPTFQTPAPASGNTLDQSYDEGGAGAGRTIDVDSGAVALTVSDTDNNTALEITQNDTTNNPNALLITNAGTGNSVELAGAGTRAINSTSGNIALKTTTSGDAAITSAGDVDITANGVNPDSIKILSSNGGIDVDAAGVIVVDSGAGSGVSIDGYWSSNFSMTGNTAAALALTLSATNAIGTADISISAKSALILACTGGSISFSDGNKAGSTYSTSLVLSDSSAEWNAFETAFGEVSILNAIQQASTTGGSGASLSATLAIGNTTGGTNIEMTSGDAINATSADLALTTTTSGDVTITIADDSQGVVNTSISDAVAFSYGWEHTDTVTTTANNAIAHRGARVLVEHTTNFNLTSTSGLAGADIEVSHKGTGTLTRAIGALIGCNTTTGGGNVTEMVAIQPECESFNSATVTDAIALKVNFNASGGTITNAHYLYLWNSLGTVTNHYFLKLDASSDVLSNGRELKILNNVTTEYIPVSKADTGLTFDASDLTLATTTSGDVRITPANDSRIITSCTSIDAVATYLGISHTTSVQPTVANAQIHEGAIFRAFLDADFNLTSTVAGLVGCFGGAQLDTAGAVTVTKAKGLIGNVQNAGAAGTITEGWGVEGRIVNSSTGTFTDGMCFAAYVNESAGTITNAHGLYLVNHGGTPANTYFLKLDATSSWLSNSRALPVLNNATTEYLVLSENDTADQLKQLTRNVQMAVVGFTTDVSTGDGKFYVHIPDSLNGMNLVAVHARVITAGTTGTTDIQIHNVTDVVDMLSTKLTIDSGETGSDTAATPAVIDAANDDVVTNDLLRVDVDAVSTTPPKGLIVTLDFRRP